MGFPFFNGNLGNFVIALANQTTTGRPHVIKLMRPDLKGENDHGHLNHRLKEENR